MPSLYHNEIINLKHSYNNVRWFEKLFFPYQLAFELERYSVHDENNPGQLAVFKAFEDSTWFFHKRFFTSLQRFSDLNITKSLRIVNFAGLLTSDVAQANFNAVIAHQNPMRVAAVLHRLHTAGLLTGDTVQANFNAVVAHQDPGSLAYALRRTHIVGLLTGDTAQANFNAVVAHQDPMRVATVLHKLHTADLLTGDTTQANFNAVVAHQDTWSVDQALGRLHTVGLLTGDTAQANFNAVVAHQDTAAVHHALYALDAAGLLTGDAAQANFNAVVITHAAVLLHPNNHHNEISLWNIMPHGQPTATQFQEMIQIAQTHAANPDAASQALMHYVIHHILDMNPQQNRQQPIFNNTQSTHTASVHASASQTATNLLNRYESRIQGAKLNTILQKFASWVNARTPLDLKQQAAAHCIDRLTNSNYFYTDSVSHVSTQQLMALAWVAVHDESARTATLDDAKQQLIEALYEIQRGYNLSEIGVDDHAPADRPICTGGTFNKWCEKLSGVHQDAVMLFITHAGAAAKLPIVAREEARRYLDTLTPGSQDYVILQNQINNETLQPLWDTISTNVANRLFDEFGSLYRQGRHSSAFTAFFSQGLYALDSAELTRPTAQLAVTPNLHTLFQVSDNSADTQQPENVLSATQRHPNASGNLWW